MKQIKAEIYQWAVVTTDDPYLAPELRKQYINGLLELIIGSRLHRSRANMVKIVLSPVQVQSIV